MSGGSLPSYEPEAHAYTDGASTGSRGPGGYGVVISWNEKTEEISGSEQDTTTRGHPLHRRTGRFRRTRRTLIAVLKPFLQVLVACRRSLRCDPADDGYERHADPMPLEIECERHTRPCAVVERFDGDARARPDRSSDTVSGPAPGVIDLRYLLGHRPLSATDPAGCGEP